MREGARLSRPPARRFDRRAGGPHLVPEGPGIRLGVVEVPPPLGQRLRVRDVRGGLVVVPCRPSARRRAGAPHALGKSTGAAAERRPCARAGRARSEALHICDGGAVGAPDRAQGERHVIKTTGTPPPPPSEQRGGWGAFSGDANDGGAACLPPDAWRGALGWAGEMEELWRGGGNNGGTKGTVAFLCLLSQTAIDCMHKWMHARAHARKRARRINTD